MKKNTNNFNFGLILAAQTFAHDLYLKAENHFAAPNGTVKFEAVNGDFNESIAPTVKESPKLN